MSSPRTSEESAHKLLNTNDLQQLIINYTHATPSADEEFKGKNFKSENYSPLAVGSTFFESRLPTITLLNHVIRGEYKAADAMLTKNALLLLECDTVTDYSGRVHSKRTAYQLARGAGDVDIVNGQGIRIANGMAEMIEYHFSRLIGRYIKDINRNASPEDIDQIIKKQYEEQFPKGFEKKEEKRVEHDRAALNRVFNIVKWTTNSECKKAHEMDDKIQDLIWDEKGNVKDEKLHSIDQLLLKVTTDEDFEAAFATLIGYLRQVQTEEIIESPLNFMDILRAIYQFRNHMEPKEAVTSGFHYNPRLSMEADKLHMHNYMFLGPCYGTAKDAFCWQKILGYTDRFLPACDARVAARRAWEYWRNSEGACRHYFPLSNSSRSLRLGYNCARMQPFAPEGMYRQDLKVFHHFILNKETTRLPYYNDTVSCKNCCCFIM